MTLAGFFFWRTFNNANVEVRQTSSSFMKLASEEAKKLNTKAEEAVKAIPSAISNAIRLTISQNLVVAFFLGIATDIGRLVGNVLPNFIRNNTIIFYQFLRRNNFFLNFFKRR